VSAGQGGLAGKVVVVTGAASGQGRATAVRLAREGAPVAAIDVNAEGLASLAAEIEAAGGTMLPLEVDVASQAAVEEAFARVRSELGPTYVLAAAAAIYPPPREVVDLPADEVERIFAVNVYGIFHCARAAGRQMIEAGEGGRILLWSSVGARLAIAGYSAYCASKGAVEGFSHVLAVELGPHGVLVNVIAPGAIDTPMLAGADLDTHASLLPSGRVGQPEDVAELAAYLCSPLAGFVTGTTITIDGGSCAVNGLVVAQERLAQAAT
jgi:2-hydroxycyclohexanecarboxyl-CoA dehydrogenase